MYQPHAEQIPIFSDVTAIRLERTHKHSGKREHSLTCSLIAIVALLVATLATELPAQESSSRLLTGDLPGQTTVSTNQLETPNKALNAAQHARNYLLAGRVDQAQKEITRALDISPHCAIALNIQGAIYLERRQFENAHENFDDAIKADPTLGSAHLGLAMSLIARNRLAEALTPLDHATNLLPGSWLAHFETAITHLGLGDADAALKEIGYAERFTQGDAERRSGTVYVRGIAYIHLGDYESAKKFLGDAVTFDPKGFYATLAVKRLEQLRPQLASVK